MMTVPSSTLMPPTHKMSTMVLLVIILMMETQTIQISPRRMDRKSNKMQIKIKMMTMMTRKSQRMVKTLRHRST